MNKSVVWLALAVLTFSILPVAFSSDHVQFQTAAQSAQYHITFTSTWSQDNHPELDLPAGAHFSRLVGTSHNESVTLWAIGDVATDGIESMAETGGTSLLLDEVAAAITAGNADQQLLGSGLSSATGTITLSDVTVQSEFPFITLVTMIAPSPDWFTGIDRLSLQDDDGKWIAKQTVDIFWYDSGTDSGLSFLSPNMDTNPPEPIRRLSGEEPFIDIPIGSITVMRTDVLPPTSTPTEVPTATATVATTAFDQFLPFIWRD